MEKAALGLIILILVGLLLLIISLAVAYSGKKGREVWYRLFPPRCERCGKKGARPHYKDYDPRDPGSLDVEFLCPKCEAEKQKAQFKRLHIGEKK